MTKMANLFDFRHYLRFRLKNRQTISQLRSGDIDSRCRAATTLAATESGHASRILLGVLKNFDKKQGRQPQNERLRTALINALVSIGSPWQRLEEKCGQGGVRTDLPRKRCESSR